jgi:hypothetical protein
MNRDLEKALEAAGFAYLGCDIYISSGLEFERWMCPDGETVIEITVQEVEDDEPDGEA